MKKKNRKLIARAVSAILNNEDTPDRIYNALSDEVADLSSASDAHSVETIEAAIKPRRRAKMKPKTWLNCFPAF